MISFLFFLSGRRVWAMAVCIRRLWAFESLEVTGETAAIPIDIQLVSSRLVRKKGRERWWWWWSVGNVRHRGWKQAGRRGTCRSKVDKWFVIRNRWVWWCAPPDKATSVRPPPPPPPSLSIHRWWRPRAVPRSITTTPEPSRHPFLFRFFIPYYFPALLGWADRSNERTTSPPPLQLASWILCCHFHLLFTCFLCLFCSLPIGTPTGLKPTTTMSGGRVAPASSAVDNWNLYPSNSWRKDDEEERESQE